MDTVWIIVVWLLAILFAYFGLVYWNRLKLVRRRLFAGKEDDDAIVTPVVDETDGWLTRWLMLAGYRAPGAAASFVLSAAFTLVLGLVLALLLAYGGPVDLINRLAAPLPPAITALVLPVVAAMPWILGLTLAGLPWLVVRGARRERVQQIERGLPIALDLLATLSETGMGFDSSLARIVDNDTSEGALREELQIFQLETLAGVGRAQCFRRLARRCEVGSMSIFCAALVQAEQVGAGFSTVLRHQADDLRGRRRERALVLAQALPVKLVFPLVICFLPGIFLTTIGPAFLEFSELIGGLVR